jgi:hypothetical protein
LLKVGHGAGAEVVEADDLMAVGEQPVNQCGADEPGGSGDESPHG